MVASTNPSGVVDARSDFRKVKLGDARLERRLRSVAEAVQEHPSVSFPVALGSDAATEGFYRLISNDKVDGMELLDAHVRATHDRAVQAGSILAVHDSSLFQFSGDQVREGTFRTARGKSGFLGHTCLALTADGRRRPLGLLGLIPVVRDQEEGASGPGVVYDNEAQRWQDLVAVVDDEAQRDLDILHVMDSEGDDYALLDAMVELELDFLVRLCHNRRTLSQDGPSKLKDELNGLKLRMTRDVKLSERKASPKGQKKSRRQEARDERIAKLDVLTGTVTLVRPAGSSAEFPTITVNIVRVMEPSPPKGQPPVNWVLATTWPVDTSAQVSAVVDAYRARWLIEEWFKALKTGCVYKERQLESLDTLLVAFALLAPVATRLLGLRWLSRNEPKLPATEVLTEEEIVCLRLMERRKKRTLPARPTVHDVTLALARQGGFLTRNGAPGWLVLGRGFERFSMVFEGFVAFREVLENGGFDTM